MSFLLTKWYLDCVSAEGQVFIGYWGELRWGGLMFHVAQSLRRDAKGEVRFVTRSGRVPAPELNGDVLNWSAASLGVEGCWRDPQPSVRRRLFDSPQGFIDWNCEMPAACAEIRFRDEKGSLTGRGYAECLQMTIKPWQLLLEELHWGRFHSDQDTVVWVQWRGPHPLSLIIHNDKTCTEETAISQDRVALTHGAVLDLAEHSVLRTGPLASTALSRLAALQRRLPSKILALDETKWLSRGTLRGSDGWAIHEVVRWP